MRTRVLVDPGDKDALEDRGLITDFDIFAMVDQTIILNDIAYSVVDVRFIMQAVGKNISTEKQIIIKEVQHE